MSTTNKPFLAGVSILGTLFLIVLCCGGLLTPPAPDTGQDDGEDWRKLGDISNESFDEASSFLLGLGLTCVRDPNATNTVRIYLNPTDTVTKQQALEIVQKTRAILGANAIVYLKDDQGETVAKFIAGKSYYND